MDDTQSGSGGNPAAPATFEQAFAAEASPAPDPASETPSAQPAVTAESETAVPGQTTGEDDRSPLIPRARFDEVNTKLRELKAWKDSRPWAEHIEPAAFETMAQWYGKALADPRAFAIQLLDELSNHPEHAPAIRSELARRLGTRQIGTKTDDPNDLAPDVEITDANGNVVGRTYSDAKLAKREDHLRRQIQQEMDEKYSPHLKTLDAIRQERERQHAEAQASSFAKGFASELAALPLFEQHKAEIGKALQAMPLESDHPDAVRAATYRAYHQVVGPKLLQGSQQAVLADLQRKAHASTSVNPATAALSGSKAPKSFHDLPADAWT